MVTDGGYASRDNLAYAEKKGVVNILFNKIAGSLQNKVSIGLDEAPHACKDIGAVMKSQPALVDIIGRSTPKIVKMEGWHQTI